MTSPDQYSRPGPRGSLVVMSWTQALDRAVSSGIGRIGVARPSAARPARDAGRRRSHARAVWFGVAAAVNGGLVTWWAGGGEAGSRAVQCSLAAFCIAVAARHDGIARAVFVLGRLVP